MSKELEYDLDIFIKTMQNKNINTNDAISRFASIYSSYEESFLLEMELSNTKEPIKEDFLEQMRRLNEHNKALNEMLFLQTFGYLTLNAEEAIKNIKETKNFVF